MRVGFGGGCVVDVGVGVAGIRVRVGLGWGVGVDVGGWSVGVREGAGEGVAVDVGGIRVGVLVGAAVVEILVGGWGGLLAQAVMKITARSKLTPAARLLGTY